MLSQESGRLSVRQGLRPLSCILSGARRYVSLVWTKFHNHCLSSYLTRFLRSKRSITQTLIIGRIWNRPLDYEKYKLKQTNIGLELIMVFAHVET